MSLGWIAMLLGLVEGLTEFLPVSSTGHLILAGRLVGFEGRRADVFIIVIQLGAVLAVIWEYRGRLAAAATDLVRGPAGRSLALKLGLAFLPSATLGFLAHEFLLRHLFHSASVAAALIVGGLLILLVEALPLVPRTHEVDAMRSRQALAVGLSQCLALWPGFSRSAATILGGLVAGLDRRTATEFSFLLAIPTLAAAAGYELIDSYRSFEPPELGWLAVSFAVSFLVAWGSIRWLLAYVSTHTFRPFAWYRLALGLAVLWVV